MNSAKIILYKTVLTVINVSLVILTVGISKVLAHDTDKFTSPTDPTKEYFTGDCRGLPAYTPGKDVGVFISCSPDRTSWSVRWNGDADKNSLLANRMYIFTGDIRAFQIANVIKVNFEDGATGSYPDNYNLTIGINNQILSFDVGVNYDIDGLDFTVAGNNVEFSFDGNLLSGSGSYTLTESNIFIGEDGEHPKNINFNIKLQ